jgi:hypothetical protein
MVTESSEEHCASTYKVEAAGSSEKLVTFQLTSLSQFPGDSNPHISYIFPSLRIKYDGLKSGLRGGQEIGRALSMDLHNNNITKMLSFGWHPFCSAPYKIDLENHVISLY